MAQRKLQVHTEYRYGKRGVLTPGDKFRVRGGPIYITDDGKKIPMGERGLFVFKRYCQRGADKWIEAVSVNGGGIAVLWTGKSCRSPAVSNLVRRPYRIVGKLRDKSAQPERKRNAQRHHRKSRRPVVSGTAGAAAEAGDSVQEG